MCNNTVLMHKFWHSMPVIKTMELQMDLCTSGYHVHKEVNCSCFSEELSTEKESGNAVDHYASHEDSSDQDLKVIKI